MRCADLDRGVVSRTEQVSRSADRDSRLAAEDVEPFFERVDVRVNRSPGGELVHAEAGVHRPRRIIHERDIAIALAMPLERRMVPKRRFLEPPEVVHYGCSIGLPSGVSGTGTRFAIGLIDFRYANIAFRSSSGNCPYQFHGIGGRIGRLLPMCLPCLSAVTNMSSVQMPRPVFMSGVKFAAKETPQSPLHAVR